MSNHQTLPEILIITTYPPKECGIATYTQDLIFAIKNKFQNSFNISICALESNGIELPYSDDVKYILHTDNQASYLKLANDINQNDQLKMVLIQHEFGLYENNESHLLELLNTIKVPKILGFHTVLPKPDELFKQNVQKLTAAADSLIVMTKASSKILVSDYGILQEKITVIPHGTHLVPHANKAKLKVKYKVENKKVLSTFGFLGAGKSIETTLDAMPAIIQENENVIFLIIGKTHPSVLKRNGEQYRSFLEKRVDELGITEHVKFINSFIPLNELLEYLQMTDVYLFTSKDPNQAVSGTFSYAISCGCPIISTPIPHAIEVLGKDAGIIFDFGDARQLAIETNKLLNDDQLRKNMGSRGLHKMASTAWENAAICHATLFKKIVGDDIHLDYKMPPINLDHIKKMTPSFAMIQFSEINQPDLESGYTLDDNARAMVAMCMHYELTKDAIDLKYISKYLNFIHFCLQPDGKFLNYVNIDYEFTPQNYETNLEDSNGRTIWALGHLISLKNILPADLIKLAKIILNRALANLENIHSTRAMAFIIKGLYYANVHEKSDTGIDTLVKISNRLVQMYRHEADDEWKWYESYLTYGNSILPEAMLCAWMTTGEIVYKNIAKSSFDFLMDKTFFDDSLKIISNKTWMHKSTVQNEVSIGGEQPIDVAYTILALKKFYDVFKDQSYLYKMHKSFDWFLGNNFLNQIIYNPCTGGCCDGLEKHNVNLNQGAESTVSYLMARLTIEKHLKGQSHDFKTEQALTSKIVRPREQKSITVM